MPTSYAETAYPFTAVVGQEEMKKALVLNAVNPALGGVLIRGEKGTAKSTAVRGLAALLPEIEVVEGCACNCPPGSPELMCAECRGRLARGEQLPTGRRPMPVVELPLGATEDRVVGSLNLERALSEGRRHFEAGLLAAANRGIIYVDEVNLLDDHLVDVLLDAAASGRNIVEREGVSVSHPAAFILVGTMNPEEGELRPQLLDRFGLCVEVRSLSEVPQRAEVAVRRLGYEGDPVAFRRQWLVAEAGLKEAIRAARRLLPSVRCAAGLLQLAIEACLRLGVVGHRADLFIAKCARTIAALRAASEVERRDIVEAAGLVLPHRLQLRPADEDGEQPQPSLKESLREMFGDGSAEDGKDEEASGSCPQLSGPKPQGQLYDIGPTYPVRKIFSPRAQLLKPRSGRRSTVEASSASGRYVAATPPRQPGRNFEVALDATLRAAAPQQLWRERGNLALKVEWADLRQKVRCRKTGNTIVFLVDASGSMAAGERMSQTKGAILSLLLDAGLRRDRVGLVSFRGDEARLVLAPTNSLEQARRSLRRLPVGGATPLSRGLQVAHETLLKGAPRNREAALLVVVSDGKANRATGGGARHEEARRAALARYHDGGDAGAASLFELTSGRALKEALEVAAEIKRSGIESLVVDTAAAGRGKRNQMRRLAGALGGTYVRMEELRSERLVHLVGWSLAGSSKLRQRR